MNQNAKTNKTKNMCHIDGNMSHIKKQGGITLIALVITIVVLLILAGVSVNAIIGDEGIVNKAKEAQIKMNEAQQNDRNSLNSLSNWLDEALNEIVDNTNGENTTSGNTTGGNTTGGNTTGGGETPENQSPKVTIGGAEVTLTEQNVGQYLGKVVSNYKSGATGTTESITIGSTSYTVSTQYRLYYVDFDNKYGDGEGTIYLKADCTSNNYALQTDTTSADAENVKIKNLNPALYAEGVTSPIASYESMEAVTWLTNTSNWEGLKDTSTTISSKINYVVGSPSLEMMMDSYNTHYGLTGTTPDTSTLSETTNRVKLFYQYPYNSNNFGYGVGPSNNSSASNGCNTYTSGYTVKTDSAIDSMYYPGDNQYYWLASPSAYDSGNVMGVDYGIGGRVGNGDSNDSIAFCPVVSLQSDVQLELEQ